MKILKVLSVIILFFFASNYDTKIEDKKVNVEEISKFISKNTSNIEAYTINNNYPSIQTCQVSYYTDEDLMITIDNAIIFIKDMLHTRIFHIESVITDRDIYNKIINLYSNSCYSNTQWLLGFIQQIEGFT